MRIAFLLFGVLLCGFSLAAPDEELLGRSEGYPACKPGPGFAEQRCLVWTYSHFDEIIPSRKVAKPAVARELKRAAKEPAGFDYEGYLKANRATGLLLLQGDTILLERYQYERKPEHRFTSMSMAKTVVAMLVGIAIEEGKIKSVDDLAAQYVPELKGAPYGGTRLRHLLTMSSGVKFTERYDGNDDVSVLGRKTFGQQGPGGADTVATFTERARPEGDRFSYASAETQVLGLVLRAAVGRNLSEYLSEKIWQPMGAEGDAAWNIDRGGYETGFAGLNATLRDWGRLGLLLANDGALDGRQIIPAAWVRAATTPESSHLSRVNPWFGYGYQTWLIVGGGRSFALRGVRGQTVFVDPDLKLVLVNTNVHATPVDIPGIGNQLSLWNAVRRTYAH